MKLLPPTLAGMVIVTKAMAATVTVTPPTYTIDPPAFTIKPPAFSFTAPVGPAGPPGPAVDLTPILNRLTTLEAAVKVLQTTVPVPPPPSASLIDPCPTLPGKWDTLAIDNTVSIAAALACANPGFNLALKDGIYNQVAHVGIPGTIGGLQGHADRVVISGQGGCTVAQNNNGPGGCPTRLAYGKGVLHFTVDNFTVHDVTLTKGGSNATDGHDGQAGVYIDAPPTAAAGTFTIKHVLLLENENGVFANNANTTTNIVITESDFVRNGTDGGSHSAYLAGGASVVYNNIHDYGSNLGNNQKSRVPLVTYNGGWNKSVQGRWIECADGCTLVVNGGDFVGNDCCQNMLANGSESTSKGPGNTIWHGPSRIWLQRPTDFANAGTFQADSNVVVFMCSITAGIGNSKGGALNGLTIDPACSTPIPSDPPYISTTGTM